LHRRITLIAPFTYVFLPFSSNKQLHILVLISVGGEAKGETWL
jgi:hypothetical protein